MNIKASEYYEMNEVSKAMLHVLQEIMVGELSKDVSYIQVLFED